MGNICRSPAAEVIFHSMVEEAGLGVEVEVDSAGTIGYHAGNPPDYRMRAVLEKRGYRVFGKSRKVTKEDLDDFDLILAMDEENLADLKSLDKNGVHSNKIQEFVSYLKGMSSSRIPDPYYGGQDGFERVIDLLEDGCSVLLDMVKKRT